MCGLTGYIDFGESSTPEILQRMTRSLAHRGPDDEGTVIRRYNGSTIGFGFRRLSVIDLSPAGHQPMINPTTGDVIVFNGEVYNFQELRKELEAKGHLFNSNTDTEVVLKAYNEWGMACVKRFIGMFAFAIFDPSLGKVIFFRDRAGVKPLYCYKCDNLFLFASELKAFHEHPGFKRKLDFDAVRLYFHHGYIPSPYCIFKNAFKLQPGHRLELDLKTGKYKQFAYWDLFNAFNKPKLNISFEEASEELERLLVSAFQYRMVADVPVGVFLSGGYDSTGVTALLQEHASSKLKTFTISTDNERFNEGPYARAVADHLDTDHYDIRCTDRDALELVQMLPQVYDEPLADGGAIPNILVSLKAAEHVKVVLSADGGDEIFAGYTKHLYSKQQYQRYFSLPYPVKRSIAGLIGMANRFRSWPIHRYDRISRLQSFLEAPDAGSLFERLNQTFTDYEISRFLTKRTRRLYNHFMNDHLLGKSNDELDRIIAIDFKTYLSEDILPKVDRATSFASIEGREPILDHRVIEFAATLPSDFKLRDGKGKYILRDIVHRYVPSQIMDQPKMGFGVPVNLWGLNELQRMFDACFDRKFIRKQDIFNTEEILSLYQNYRSGNLISFDRMYTVFIFQQWYRKWMM